MKAYGGSPPPFDQPGLMALLKLKTVVGCEGELGGPLLCAPQLPNFARMMRHITWSRARFNDALLRREAVDEQNECALWLNDSMLAAPKALTATVRQNLSSFCTDRHAS